MEGWKLLKGRPQINRLSLGKYRFKAIYPKFRPMDRILKGTGIWRQGGLEIHSGP